MRSCPPFCGVVLLAQVAGRAAWRTPMVPRGTPGALAPSSRSFLHLPSAAGVAGVARHSKCGCQAASFRTEVHVPKVPVAIQLEDRLFFMGSCFSENIGSRFKALKFQVEVNPFGICYNPLSLAWNLERLMDGSPFNADDITGSMGRFFSYKHHSSFSSGNAAVNINVAIDVNVAYYTHEYSKTYQDKLLLVVLGDTGCHQRSA